MNRYTVIPEPVSFKVLGDLPVFTLTDALCFEGEPETEGCLKDLLFFLSEVFDFESLGVGKEKIRLEIDGKGREEGYSLKVEADRIILKGNDEKGLFYAVQTLKQLLFQGELTLPEIYIEDSPRFSYRGFMLDCGIKIAGSGTRAYDKKSFQLKFRGIYGTADLEYDIFGTGIETFQNIKLRCGEDYFRATFRDELQASLVMDGMDSLLAQRYRWFVLYIDSEYFGLYAFRDMTDENYIAKAENTEASNVTKLECDGNNKISTNKDFINLVNFCYTKDLSIEENYKYVTDRLDIASVTQWFIARSYSNDRDFGNCRYYRIGDDGKWKWIFYDCDWGFYYEYMPRSPYDILASDYHLAFPTVKIMIGLFKSPIYRDYYCQELAKHLKTTYNTAHILERIEELNATVLPEIPRDRERWPQGSYDKYLTMVEDMRNFAKDCPSYFVKSTAKFLSLSDAQVRAYFGDIIYG